MGLKTPDSRFKHINKSIYFSIRGLVNPVRCLLSNGVKVDILITETAEIKTKRDIPIQMRYAVGITIGLPKFLMLIWITTKKRIANTAKDRFLKRSFLMVSVSKKRAISRPFSWIS